MSNYVFVGDKQWKPCCKSLSDYTIPNEAKLVYLAGNLPQFLPINGNIVQVPAHMIILNLSPEIADSFIEQGIMIEAEESDFSTMNGVML